MLEGINDATNSPGCQGARLQICSPLVTAATSVLSTTSEAGTGGLEKRTEETRRERG